MKAGGIIAALLIVYAVGMVVAVRLLPTAHGGASHAVTGFPTDWGVTRFAGNPVIDVDDNPAEDREQYTPAPIRLANGDIWVYVKGTSRIYAWKSTDGGETFSLENGGVPVIAPVAATWEGSFTLDPIAVYDEADDTIHLWYKGRDANPANWQIGHATAPGSDPTDFTRDPANPILTKAAAEADLGDDTGDLSLGDVIVIDGTFHFYLYGEVGGVGGEYHLMHATGTTWNDPSGVASILPAPVGGVVSTPAVVRIPGVHRYAMFYSHDVAGGTVFPERIKVGSSSDGVSWSFPGTDVITPTTGWEDDSAYAGHFLRRSTYPYDLPVVDALGRWLFYYSGYDATPDEANSGLAYLEPT